MTYPVPAIYYKFLQGYTEPGLFLYARRRSYWGTAEELRAADRDMMNFIWIDGCWHADRGWDCVAIWRPVMVCEGRVELPCPEATASETVASTNSAIRT
jgi:hypothetical protein